jgi:hypothetical protein
VCRALIFKAPGSISVRQKGASFKLKEAETLRVPAHVTPHVHVYQHLAPEVRSEKMLRLVVLKVLVFDGGLKGAGVCHGQR